MIWSSFFDVEKLSTGYVIFSFAGEGLKDSLGVRKDVMILVLLGDVQYDIGNALEFGVTISWVFMLNCSSGPDMGFSFVEVIDLVEVLCWIS